MQARGLGGGGRVVQQGGEGMQSGVGGAQRGESSRR